MDNANGDVLISDRNVVDVFEPTALGGYAFVRTLTGTPAGSFHQVVGVAVDSATGDTYVIDDEEGIPPVVDQFGSDGVYRGHLAGTPEGPFTGRLQSVAVDPATRDVYVGNRARASFVDVFGPTVVVPDVTTEPASEVKPMSATLNGTVNPDEAGAATCQFVYGTTRSFGQVAPCSAAVADGGSAVPVHGEAAGLEPDTTYFYRLQASNASGTNPGESTQDQQFKTPGPGIRGEFATDAAATSVTLGATIDPDGAPTTSYFQYSTSDTAACGLASCATVPAPPGASVGSGHGDSSSSQYVSGLSAGTTYHYRVVALSELAGSTVAFYGPDQTFTTQIVGGGSPLLDGRQWEMVSPPNKHGALLLGNEGIGLAQAAASGDAMTYLASAPIEAEPQGYTNLRNSQTLATRTSSGWASRDIAIPNETSSSQAIGTVAEYPFFSEDLTRALVQPLGGFIPASSPQALAPAEATEQTAFLRTDYVGGDHEHPCVVACYRPLVTGMPGFANVPPGTQFGQGQGSEGPCPPGVLCGPQFLGATSDARHVVLESTVPLTEGSNARLYEWSEGTLAPVSGISELGTGNIGRHAISADGSQIIGTNQQDRHLYLRDMAKKETVLLDAVRGGSGVNETDPQFQDASSDGSKVFFTDAQQLTADSRATVQAPDLYECAIVEVAGKPTCRLSDLTVAGGREAGDAQGVVGASQDGSWIYFVANGVLAQGAATGDCIKGRSEESSRTCNLYVRHDGTTRLVAILSDTSLMPEFGRTLTNTVMRVSPNGQWLAFMSQRELTGNDTHDAITGTPDYEVYLYHAPSDINAETGTLVCASCNPTGARPVGVEYPFEGRLVAGAAVWNGQSVAASVPAWTKLKLTIALYQSRYLSDSGRLFFNSSDALVPQDVNGNEDVYEYEPAGVGDCASSSPRYSQRSAGCVGLVSSGEAAGESAFLDASESGGDVFFLTSGQLAPQDYDTALDVYDAHECTSGSPCLSPPVAVAPPCDTGDSCKPAPSPQPAIFGAPSSATFNGAGNVNALAPPAPKPKTASQLRAERLAKALKACRTKHNKHKRAECQRQAHKRYGPPRKAKKARHTTAARKGGK